MASINDIKPFLSSWEDIQKQLTGNPITFKINKNSQHLFYFGSNHTFDPNHPQFKQIKEFFDEFIKLTNKDNRVAAVEGGIRPVESSPEESIEAQGEAGYICYLASKENVRIISPEPERSHEMEGLLDKFTKDEIQYYYFARVVHQWNRRNPKPNFEEYLSRFIENDRHETGWMDYDFSIENMKSIHKKIFNTEFDENDMKFFYNAVNPVELNYVTNKYSREIGVNRYAFIVKTLLDEWNKGNSIFVVFGSGHALTERNALEKFLLAQ